MIDTLFEKWIKADAAAYEIKKTIKQLEHDLLLASNESTEAMIAVRDYMEHNGLVEDTINGELIDYKISFTTPRQSVKIENPDAVPDDFCKIERVPELKKIKEFIAEGNQPNWATVGYGTSNLTYKAIVRK